jgi:hypothetical protein
VDAGALTVVIPRSPATPGPTTRPTRVAAHPIVGAVQSWNSLDLPIAQQSQMPEGFEPILWSGDKPIVAVRATPVRQVWSAIDVNGWSNRPEYVIFWTAVFDWMGEGGETFTSYDLSQWTNDWRWTGRPDSEAKSSAPRVPDASMLLPGLYIRADGALRAFDAPTIKSTTPPPSDWRADLRQTGNLSVSSTHSDSAAAWRKLAPWFLLGSLGCLTGAAALWRRSAGLPATSANPAPVSVSDSA